MPSDPPEPEASSSLEAAHEAGDLPSDRARPIRGHLCNRWHWAFQPRTDSHKLRKSLENQHDLGIVQGSTLFTIDQVADADQALRDWVIRADVAQNAVDYESFSLFAGKYREEYTSVSGTKLATMLR
ncbi:hypothetical protein RI367_000015 [Sorochytrium milnesiophthora]